MDILHTCSLCCLKRSKVVAGSCRKTNPCSEFNLHVIFKTGFKSEHRNSAWVCLAFFTEPGINLIKPYNTLRHQVYLFMLMLIEMSLCF